MHIKIKRFLLLIITCQKMELKQELKIKYGKPVRCVETDVVYYSAAEAKRQSGIEHIGCACRGERNTAGGYHWEFIDQDAKESSNKRRRELEGNKNTPKQIICIETGSVYRSITDAYKQTKIRHISEACNGRRKTAGGYHWEFLEE